jgi:hypothetical protein
MASSQPPSNNRNDAESLLKSLAGIVSAHVVRGAGGRPVEIHVLASGELHPKQVVRNVESALRAGLGMDVDRRIISVAQVRTSEDERVDEAEPGTTSPPKENNRARPKEIHRPAPTTEPLTDLARTRRLEFVRYRSHRQGDRATCEVVLRDARTEITGQGTGSSTAGGRAEAAARAVMDAIVQARPELQLELEEVTITSARGRTFVIAAAHVMRGRDVVRLAGAATMTRSPEEAAILAALQATNRWSA